VVAVLGSWFAYDGFCRSALRNAPPLLGATIVFYLSLLAYFLSEVFSGRAAYIHVGAAIGTMMVGNVFFVIIPAQKEMVRAMLENRTIDPAVGKNGLLRSTHNNYLTLPVLFLMISNHFPSTYGHSWNWLVLILISLISVAVRHYFNVRKIFASLWLILPGAFLAVLLVMWFTAPEDQGLNTAKIEKIEIYPVIQQRCTGCHSDSPTQPGFVAPPSGVVMDTIDQVNTNADRIYQAAVLTKTMPIGNLTEITQQERDLISRWYFSLDSSGVSE
jgi:uncharacterized membrane protein